MNNKLQKTKQNQLKSSGKKNTDLAGLNMNALNQSLSGLTLPRLFYQLVVFVLDGSGSMTFEGITGESKGIEVEGSIKKVIKRLKTSKNNNSFDVAMFAYANESVEIMPMTSIPDINLSKDLNPCNHIKYYEQTYLEESIIEVKKLTDYYLDLHNSKNAQVLIFILSDGAIHDQDEAERICRSIDSDNNRIKISSTLFESKTWKEKYQDEDLEFLRDNLKSLASSKELFTSTLEPEEVRKHMIKSISTVSRID